MKTRTKKELQELAVRALGEGATVRVALEGTRGNRCYRVQANDRRFEYWVDLALRDGGPITKSQAMITLAAALEALAEVRK
jgi:hypothetical protein